MKSATVEGTARHGVLVSVTIATDPERSMRTWFPKSQFWNDGAGNLFAAKWIIERKSKRLKAGGLAGICVDSTRGFWK